MPGGAMMNFRQLRTRAFFLSFAVMTSGFGNNATSQDGTTNPAIARVEIANGSFNTAYRLVTLRITASDTPTAYRAS
jgi:hypothetical protein